MLDAPTDRAKWEKEARCSYLNQDEVDTAWSFYNHMYQSTQYLKNSSLDFSFLASAISRFRNLNEIIVLDPFGFPSEKLEDIQAKALLPLDSTGDEGTGDADPIRSLQSILFAVVAANAKLEKLTVELLNWGFWDQHASLYYPALANLKHITLVMNGNILDVIWSAEHERLVSALGTALKAATALESLTLSCSTQTLSYDNFDEFQIDWERLSSTSYWPSLQSLNLSNIRTSEDSLVRFLERHSMLRRLELSWARLSPGDWHSVIRRIKSVSNLEIFELREELSMVDAESTENRSIFINSYGAHLNAFRDYGREEEARNQLQEYFFGDGDSPLPPFKIIKGNGATN
jgi:hypothetical protein